MDNTTAKVSFTERLILRPWEEKDAERSSVMLSRIFIWILYGAVILKEMISPGVSRKNVALLIIIPTGISIGS